MIDKEPLLERLKTKNDNHDFFAKWTIQTWNNPSDPTNDEIAECLIGADIPASKENILIARDFFKKEYLPLTWLTEI